MAYYNGQQLLQVIETVGIDNVILEDIADNIDNATDFISYLNSNSVDISATYKNKIVFFKSKDSVGDGWYTFIVIPNDYENNGIILFNGYYRYSKGTEYQITEYATKSLTGNLSDLTTTRKSSLVAAINEVSGKANTNISDLNNIKPRVTKNEQDIAQLNAIIHETVAMTAEETYNNVDNITTPTSVTVGGTAYPVIDNTRMLLAGVKGKTVKSDNKTLYDNSTQTISGVSIAVSNGIFTLNGTATDNIRLYSTTLLISGTQYSLNMFNNQTNDKVSYNIRTSIGGSVVSVGYLNSLNYGRTFNANGNYFNVSIDSGAVCDNLIIKPMIVEGSTIPSEFIQGFTGLKNVIIDGLVSEDSNQEEIGVIVFTAQNLNGVSSAKDELVITKNTNDVYYTMKKITRFSSYTFTGSETWTQNITDISGKYRYMFSGINTMAKKPTSNGISANAIINDITFFASSNTWVNIDGIGINTNGDLLCYQDTIQTASDMANFMNGKTLVYEMETLTETTISSTLTYDQVSVLTKQGGTLSVSGNTNITYVKPDIVLDLEIKYWQEV